MGARRRGGQAHHAPSRVPLGWAALIAKRPPRSYAANGLQPSKHLPLTPTEAGLVAQAARPPQRAQDQEVAQVACPRPWPKAQTAAGHQSRLVADSPHRPPLRSGLEPRSVDRPQVESHPEL